MPVKRARCSPLTRTTPLFALLFTLINCEPAPTILTADEPLHLEDHLNSARIIASEAPDDVPGVVEWRFAEQQPNWKLAGPKGIAERGAVSPVDDALRMTLREPVSSGAWIARARDAVYVELPDWNREDWAYVDVRARASAGVARLGIGFNVARGEQKDELARWGLPDLFFFPGEQADVFNDGSVQTYRLRADWSWRSDLWVGPWKQLGVLAMAREDALHEPAYLDILSVSLVPKEAEYAAGHVGVRSEVRDQAYRRTLYTHAPGRLEFTVRIPPAGELNLALGVLRNDSPIRFRVTAVLGGQTQDLFEEEYADKERWAQRRIDLSLLAGKVVTLVLATECEREGSVALWAAPTLSGSLASDRPNVIFYVIDGGAAEQMSVYGYNRRTTPVLERLAAEGAVFERAYSNSSFTRPSTASFMTSLQHSVFGGLKNNRNAPPEEALTMAEHLHRAGYQTAVLTTNSNAGTMSDLGRGVDVLREAGVGDRYFESSRELHQDFWRWRAHYPGQPYWVHFQTTDVHEYDDGLGAARFAGLFVSPDRRQLYSEWRDRLNDAGGSDPYSSAFEKTGISRSSFFDIQRGLYDEAMAHQDYRIGRLVERLKAEGEWDNTLLIVAADHSFLAAGDDDFLIGMQESLPPPWAPMFRTSVSRVPMLFVWPRRIAEGMRFRDSVSMIDMLPTILDLVGLPIPEVLQGQSLAPLLLGQQGWEPRPVILDEFVADIDAAELRGTIEVIDDRWGASLEINPNPDTPSEERRPPLILYDLWNDPYCLHSLHEERSDLVRKYTNFLQGQWRAHRALAQKFTRSGDSPLTPEQLRTLRSLGYIQ